MKIRVIWFGKTKSDFIKMAIQHYLKLISSFVNLSIQEIKEEKLKQTQDALIIEGVRLFKITENYHLLDPKGIEFTSEGFAEFIKKGLTFDKTIDFVIGGPFGVSHEVKQRANKLISLSRLTFPHEVAKVLILEQIYRAFTIINNKGYHY